jgi:hypothetical protein
MWAVGTKKLVFSDAIRRAGRFTGVPCMSMDATARRRVYHVLVRP